MNLVGNQKVSLSESVMVGILTACLCSLYLPWKWTSFLLLPLYLFAWRERGSLRIDKKIIYAFIAFVGYVLLLSIISHAPRHSFKGLYDALRGLLLFPVGLAFAQLTSGRRSWTLVNFVAMSFVLGSFLFPQRGGGFYSYFANPNNAAVLLIVFVCLLVPAFQSRKPLYPYLISGIGLITALPLLFLTNARGAWLGLAGGGLCLVLFRAGIRKRYKIIAFTSILTPLTIAFLYYNRKGFRLSNREGLWSGLLSETIDNHFFFGYGFNAVKDLIDQLGLITRTAHNIFLEIFVASGFVGLIFMLFFIYFLWKTFSSFSYPNSPQFISGLLCIVAFVIMGQFDLKFSSFRFIGTISFFLGMIYSQRIEKKTAPVIKGNCRG